MQMPRPKFVTIKSLLADKQRSELDTKIAAWAPQKPDRAGNFVAITDPSWNVAVDAPTAPAQSAGAFEELAEKDLVMKAQELLSGMGYDVGPHDGVMGTRTANAVRLFQLQTGMDVNGNVSPKLVEALVAKRT